VTDRCKAEHALKCLEMISIGLLVACLSAGCAADCNIQGKVIASGVYDSSTQLACENGQLWNREMLESWAVGRQLQTSQPTPVSPTSTETECYKTGNGFNCQSRSR
jgi:hypothetical protein